MGRGYPRLTCSVICRPEEGGSHLPEYTLTDVVKSSDFLAGVPTKSLHFRVSHSPTFYWELSDEPPVSTTLTGSFPSPYEFGRIAEQVEKQKTLLVYTTVEADSPEEAIPCAEDWSERLLDWLCFLIMRPVWLLQRGQLSGGSGHRHSLVLQAKPPDHEGAVTVRMIEINPPRSLDVRKAVTGIPDPSLAWVLKWYRKSLLATKPEDQLLACWFAIEVLSEVMAIEEPGVAYCPHCTKEIPLPKVAKTAVLRHMRENLGLARKEYDTLLDARSDIVHGRRPLDQALRRRIARLVPAAQFILTTAILEQMNGEHRSEKEGIPKHYCHPVLGDLSKMAPDLSVLR